MNYRSKRGCRLNNRSRLTCSMAGILLLALTPLLGCDAAVEVVGEGAFSLIDEIEERNATAAQARVDLQPRVDSQRSPLERDALRIANQAISGSSSRVKDAFCGSPPDLSHLPAEYFHFQPSAYIPEDTPAECRAAVDRRFPDLQSCYLVFENGSTGYVNCYTSPGSATVSCMSVKRLLWEILWDAELREDCPEGGS